MNKFMLKKVRECLELPENGSQDDIITTYTANELLDKLLEYEGIIGYTSFIKKLIIGLYEIDLDLINTVSGINKIN